MVIWEYVTKVRDTWFHLMDQCLSPILISGHTIYITYLVFNIIDLVVCKLITRVFQVNGRIVIAPRNCIDLTRNSGTSQVHMRTITMARLSKIVTPERNLNIWKSHENSAHDSVGDPPDLNFLWSLSFVEPVPFIFPPDFNAGWFQVGGQEFRHSTVHRFGRRFNRICMSDFTFKLKENDLIDHELRLPV